MKVFVVRPGRAWRGQVDVGLDLWTRSGPVREDRVIFFDRPKAAEGVSLSDGSVSSSDWEWQLSAPELFEEWTEGSKSYRRWRALMVDPERKLAVGALYWLLVR
ncbi:MAG: hypothetical protein H6741_04030 [Alphaproteobacteria bacterium]|nr:hypothetical protein [Alphaproteobacteria bacterium]MCB9791874.1 hypothetical protein [Alphaproteobacteria bacterium]